MKINHFSHNHPLILKDGPYTVNGREVICHGCDKPISDIEAAYVCKECTKGYFLHKACAELPREIIHPKHEKHSLMLLSEIPYTKAYRCNECRKSFSAAFTYHCSLCKFDLDISCALEGNDKLYAFKDRVITHDAHPHPLIFQPRPALFRCDACGVEDKDLFCICPSCPFLIHKGCASLKNTVKFQHHDHVLTLAYGFPSDYRSFRFNCDICQQRIFRQYWVYYCYLCRYFVHLKCAATKIPKVEADLDDSLDDANFEKKLLKILLDDDLFHLPGTNKSAELIARFLLRKNSLANIQPIIIRASHEHPLILFYDQPNDRDIEEEEDDDEEILCNCCAEPISPPYYSCVECRYFLHLPCAKLPYKLQHSSHPHQLRLGYYLNFYDIFRCNKCDSLSNGSFFFHCANCNFFLDVKCAALPTAIEHGYHNHPLIQFEALDKSCSGCGYKFDGLGFGCEPCDFYLDYGCAMLPPAFRHRWDKHPLPLRFPPYSDHPDDFFCDMCEEEMHPKRWLYHCSQCDNSFHVDCVPRLSSFSNIKFGGMLGVRNHAHPLKFVRSATLKTSCDGCGLDLDTTLVFECEDCNFCLCHLCIYKMKTS